MSKHRLLLPVLGFFILGVIGFFLTPAGGRMLRPHYVARATLEIRPLATSLSFGRHELESAVPLRAAAEHIKSRDFLEMVVRELGLDRRWRVAPGKAAVLLEAALTLEIISGKNLLVIKVSHPDQDDALNITREVTADFSKYWREIDRKASEKVLAELNQQIRLQELKVAERRARLVKLEFLSEAMLPGSGGIALRGGRESPPSWGQMLDGKTFPKVTR